MERNAEIAITTYRHRIDVMERYYAGDKLQVKSKGFDWMDWTFPYEPSWNWGDCDYRIKEEDDG